MKIPFKSPLARFATFALFALVLPAAILAVLGYLSLRQWESSAELLVKEQARDMASMAAEKVEMVLLHAEDEILARIRSIMAAAPLFPAPLENRRGRNPLSPAG